MKLTRVHIFILLLLSLIFSSTLGSFVVEGLDGTSSENNIEDNTLSSPVEQNASVSC